MLNEHRNPDGTYDGVGVLGKVSGLPRDTMLELIEQVKANHAKLDACLYHEFEPIPGTANSSGMRQRYRCKHCGGEIDSIAYHWHEQGRRAKQCGCKRCGGAMAPIKAIAQTLTGQPDFPGDKHAVTVSPGGRGKLIDALKCSSCGWSVTA